MGTFDQQDHYMERQQVGIGSTAKKRGIELSDDEDYEDPPAKRPRHNGPSPHSEHPRETIVVGDDGEPTFSWKGSGSEVDPITVTEWVTGNLITTKHEIMVLSDDDDDDDDPAVGNSQMSIVTVALPRTPTPASEDTSSITDEHTSQGPSLFYDDSEIKSDADDDWSSIASSATVDATVRSSASHLRYSRLFTHGALDKSPVQAHNEEQTSDKDEEGDQYVNDSTDKLSRSSQSSSNASSWGNCRPYPVAAIRFKHTQLGYASSDLEDSDDDKDFKTNCQRPKAPAPSEEQNDDESEDDSIIPYAQTEDHSSRASSRHSSLSVTNRRVLSTSSQDTDDEDLGERVLDEDDDDCVIVFENVKPAHLTSEPWVLTIKEEHGGDEEELPDLQWSQSAINEEDPPDLDSQHVLNRRMALEELDRLSKAVNPQSRGKIIAELQDDIPDEEQEDDWTGPLPIELRKRLFYKVYWKAIQPYLKRMLLPFYGSLSPKRKRNECWLYSGPRFHKGRQTGLRISTTFQHRSRPTKLTIHVVFVYKLLNGRLSPEQLEGIIEEKWHASHLCGNWTCINESHVHPEPGPVNSNRNGCLPHKDLPCHHQPACLKHLKLDLELLRPRIDR